MRTRILPRLLPVVILCFCLLAGTGHAQFAEPSEIVPQAPALQFGQKNNQLRTILALQAQMQLLRSLIEHEKAVNEMVTAAVAIGVTDPLIPKPDRSLCLEVPSNIPCAQAYESLYNDYSVAQKKPEPVMAPVIAKMDDVIEKVVSKPKKKKPVEPEVVFSPFYWTNITCLNSNCSAVISFNPQDPKASYRIAPGEKLPDGTIINDISAAGVTAMRGKNVVSIEPAPKAGVL